MSRFPYLVYFVAYEQVIEVVVCLYSKRDREQFKRRIGAKWRSQLILRRSRPQGKTLDSSR